MKSEHLRGLVTATGPFASVYLDDSHDTADASVHLETTWRDIRRDLEARGASPAIIARVEKAVLHVRPAVGRRGRAVIATADEVLVNEHLAGSPPASVVRVSDYPYLVPLIDLEMRRPTYVFAAVDHAGADITLHRGRHVGSADVETGCRAVAATLTRLVDEAAPEVVFLSGEVRSLADVVAELPARVAERVSELHAGPRKAGIGEERIRELTAPEFARRHDREKACTAQRFEAETGRSGLAAQGLAAVCGALRDGDVATLIIGDLGDATVVVGDALTRVAPNADALSELGEAVRRVARADEALPFAAIAAGASLVRTDSRIAPSDGIGALLRYAAPVTG
jgi:hypothetical protein